MRKANRTPASFEHAIADQFLYHGIYTASQWDHQCFRDLCQLLLQVSVDDLSKDRHPKQLWSVPGVVLSVHEDGIAEGRGRVQLS